MPCTDGPPGGYEYRDVTQNGLNSSELQAILCGVFTRLALSGKLAKTLDQVDWEEAGITQKEAETWWKKHQAEDQARLMEEALSKKRRDARKKALKKLTPQERALLRIPKHEGDESDA